MNSHANLVSIITPTVPQRREWLLQRCGPSIARQTYRPLEWVVISDGPDECLATDLTRSMMLDVRITFAELGRNWRQFTHGASYGAMPRVVGTMLARGQFIGYLDDDDEFLPQHVERLMARLQETGADFASSQFKRFWSNGRSPDVVGCGRLEYGHIGTPLVLHRAECLLSSNWQPDGYAEDFGLFDRWQKAGLKWAHLEEITVHVHKTV
jgi:glycosyltransferase involved in cell wall biosynthesis